MFKKSLILATLVALIVAIVASCSITANADEPSGPIAVYNYDHGWKAEYLVSHTLTAPCYYNNHYEWTYQGQAYYMDEGQADACYYDVVVPMARDNIARPKFCGSKRDAFKHHSKKFARHHKNHMRKCH